MKSLITNKLFFTLVLCSASLFLGGCQKSSSESTLTLERKSNPTTGYTWFCEIRDETIVSLSKQEYIADDTKSKSSGSGGKTVFVLEGKSEGETTVTLTYKRDWEGGDVNKTETLRVTVDENKQIQLEQ